MFPSVLPFGDAVRAVNVCAPEVYETEAKVTEVVAPDAREPVQLKELSVPASTR